MKKIISSLLFSLIVFSSCGPTVQTVNKSNKQLKNYETFAYLPNSNVGGKNLGYDDQTVGKSVIESINNNMMKAGYTLDRDNPDLLVLIRTKTDTETITDTDPVYATYPYTSSIPINPYYEPYYYNTYYQYNEIIGYDTDVYKYKEGTLIMDLVDRKTKKVVWRGTASDQIYSNNDSRAIAQYVDDIFEEFPTVAGY
ncbi:DUF4136 domain-containing protein [Aquimarina sp. SS2-1]|uniref:DUF4136 domain-containing protein n=1 Tax=Aquimarina besae TaxID=3342247 RepID=UPI00366E8E84